MTKPQLHILHHSLGADQYGHGGGHRNHFCAGGSDEVICRELVAMGFMKLWPHANPETGETPGYPYYNCSVTDAGKTAMLAESPAPPKLTRSQQRYRDYLKADTGFSFREYLEMLKQRRSFDGGGRLEDYA